MELAAILILTIMLTFGLCLYARPLGELLKVMDVPTGHKQHSVATPAVGGVILAIVGFILLVGLLPWTIHGLQHTLFVRVVALATIIAAMVIGFIDDRRHLAPTTRLVLGMILAAVFLLLVPELQVRKLSLPSIHFYAETGILALPFTVLCLITLKHAVNMADGRNGLLLGMAIIWSVFFLLHALPPMIPMLVSVLGVLLVLFAFNWRGRLFMGDAGAYGLATYAGILAIALHRDAYGTVRTAEVVLLFLIPVLDLARLIMVRALHGLSPLAPDGRHFHHLLDKKPGWKWGWLVYMLLIAVPLIVYQMFYGHGAQIIVATGLVYSLVVWAYSREPNAGSSAGPDLGETQPAYTKTR